MLAIGESSRRDEATIEDKHTYRLGERLTEREDFCKNDNKNPKMCLQQSLRVAVLTHDIDTSAHCAHDREVPEGPEESERRYIVEDDK